MPCTSCRFSLSLTKITPSLPQSIYQVARSCQPVTGSKVVNDWLPAEVWGRGRSCQDRPLRGGGRSRACQSELCVTLGLATLLHCSKREERMSSSYRCGQQLGSEVSRSLMTSTYSTVSPHFSELISHWVLLKHGCRLRAKYIHLGVAAFTCL